MGFKVSRILFQETAMNKQDTGWHRKNDGFTLIELLVVIAIIALLLSIIIPSLQLAKEKTKIVICSSNIKQLVYGLVTYANDNDGKLPPSISRVHNSNNYHRPQELNWNYNQVGLVSDPEQYVGRYLGSYLPEADVYNCPVAPIEKESEWPPQTSGRQPQGTYGQFYRDGTYAPLHCTYSLLWNYQGYNHKISGAVDKSLGDFEAPSRISSSNKLVVQDNFMYLTTNTNLLWPSPQHSWYSSHRFDGADKANPYFALSDQSHTNRPSCKLNAGYLDGSVGRFDSKDATEVKNFGAFNYLGKYR